MHTEVYTLAEVNAIAQVMAIFPPSNHGNPFSVKPNWGFELSPAQWEFIAKAMRQAANLSGSSSVMIRQGVGEQYALVDFQNPLIKNVETGTHIIANMVIHDIQEDDVVVGANFVEGRVVNVWDDENTITIAWCNNSDIMTYTLDSLQEVTLRK